MMSTRTDRRIERATRVVRAVERRLAHSFATDDVRRRVTSARMVLDAAVDARDMIVKREASMNETTSYVAESYARNAILVAINVARHAFPRHKNRTHIKTRCEGCDITSTSSCRAYLVKFHTFTTRVLYCDECAEMCAVAAVHGAGSYGASSLPDVVRISTYLDNSFATRDPESRMRARAAFYGDDN